MNFKSWFLKLHTRYIRNQTYPSHMLSVCMLNKLFSQCNRTKTCVGFIWFICVHIDNQQTKMKMAYYVVYVRVYVSWKGGFDIMESVLLYWNCTTYSSNFSTKIWYKIFSKFVKFVTTSLQMLSLMI